MASLRFTFDGDRRPERDRPCPSPFPPRYYGPLGYPRFIPPYQNVNMQETAVPGPVEAEKQEEEKMNPVAEVRPPSIEESNAGQHTTIVLPVPDTVEDRDVPAANVSEQLVARLDTFELGLGKVKGQLNISRALFDDVLYKIESFLQILEVIKANEERRIQGPQAAISSLKTNKDTIDEFLELLQTPAFQGVLRQFLVGVLVKKQPV